MLCLTHPGSRTAKTKLLEKQKDGKKRMRQFGKGRNPAIRLHRRPQEGRRLTAQGACSFIR
jgi:hypothetical protein